MIHPTACVERGAELGRDVEVGPFAYVQAGAVVGERCVIGPHAGILKHTTLGSGCRVHAGAVLGDTPQDLKFRDAVTGVRVGAGCVIREGVTIHRGVAPESVTEIGEECFLMAFSHIGHNARVGRQVIVANGALLAGHVTVGDRAFISGNCLLHQFVAVGRLVMMGGGAAVSRDVPPFCLVRPVSLNRLGGLNVVGMRRAGLRPEERLQVKRAFRLLYAAGLGARAAAARIRAELGPGPAVEMAQFVEASKRGICQYVRGRRGEEVGDGAEE
jgi:UDP-N-acetylglucosamine acyltransferase